VPGPTPRKLFRFTCAVLPTRAPLGDITAAVDPGTDQHAVAVLSGLPAGTARL
jgi:hypothetical protein